MALRGSTGKRSPVKHSTASDPVPVAKSAPDYPRPRYSTSEDATIAHFTGRETDRRALDASSDVPAGKGKSAPPRSRKK